MSKKEVTSGFNKRMAHSIGAAALVMVAVTGCEEQEDFVAYENIGACVADGKFDAAQCEQMALEADQQAITLAPPYEAKEDCEEDFGANECASREEIPQTDSQQHAHGPIFYPIYHGYFGGTYGQHRSVTPIFRSSTGDRVTLSGTKIPSSAFTASGAKVYPSETVSPSTRPATFSRGSSVIKSGGFGSAGRAFSAGG